MEAHGIAIDGPKEKFHPWKFERREVGDNDVLIKIAFCGICHSDIHNARGEWGAHSKYPMVPGHEIVGKVEKVGAKVTKFKVGDIAAVGCMVDSCKECKGCKKHEFFCEKGAVQTYGGKETQTGKLTYGGYSDQIVVDDHFVLSVPPTLTHNLAGVAPLLCAGITTYAPLHRFQDKVKGKKIGVVGLGGLGHVGVKIAAAMGAEVTVFSTTDSKRDEAKRLGATNFVISKSEEEMKSVKGTLSFILNTVSAKHDATPYMDALEVEGVLAYVGVSPDPITLPLGPMIFGNKQIAGSIIGNVADTQEMLEFCAKHKILADVEVIKGRGGEVDAAFDRVVKSDVKYRFVIDLSTLEK